MTRYAVALDDLDAIWATPAGAALVDAVLARPASEETTLVTVEGVDAVVLRGPSPRVAAVAAGLVDTRLPAPVARTVRVFGNDDGTWRPVRTSADLLRLPEQQPEGGGRTCQPRRDGPERASFARASRYCTSGIGA